MPERVPPARETPLFPLGFLIPAVLLGQWAYGVGIADLIRYWLLLAFYVAIPGMMLFRASRLETHEHWLSDLAFGMGAGYALLTANFLCSRLIGLPLSWLQMPLSLFALGALLRARPRPAKPVIGRVSQAWLLAVGLFLLLVVVFKNYAVNPLPGTLEKIRYHRDYAWHMAVVGEAMHRWPMRDMQCASLPLVNHSMGHMAMAAITTLTGLELPEIFLRLFNVPLLSALLLQVYFLGRWLLRSQRAGVLSSILFLVVTEAIGARNHLFTYILHDKLLDSSFLLGLVYMATWLYLAAALLRKGRLPVLGITTLGLLTIAATGTKTPVLPVLLSGFGGRSYGAGWPSAASSASLSSPGCVCYFFFSPL